MVLRLPSFLFVCLIFSFSTVTLADEINVVPPGKRVMLMSSERRAQFKPEAPEILQLQEEVAQGVCTTVGKKLVRTTPVEITGDELLKIYESKSYSASIATSLSGGVVFQDGQFILHPFADFTPTPLSQKIEIGCWIGTGFFGLGGGMMTLVTLIGGGSIEAVMITGIVAGAGTTVSAAAATVARIYRKCRRSGNGDSVGSSDDFALDVASKESTFALPSLVSEIWCE